MPSVAASYIARSCRWGKWDGHSHNGSTAGLWTCVLLLSGDPARDCLETYQVPVTHAVMCKLAVLVFCVACLLVTSSDETLMYKVTVHHLRSSCCAALSLLMHRGTLYADPLPCSLVPS